MADPRIEDIVAMLDQFIMDGGGHMNIQVEEDGSNQTGNSYE